VKGNICRITATPIAEKDRKLGDNLLAPCFFVIHLEEDRVGAIRLRINGTPAALIPLHAGFNPKEGAAYLHEPRRESD